jgi:hypothetical protein
MKRLFFIFLITTFGLSAAGQYQLYKEVNQIEFYTKWGREKWLSKKSPRVLMVKVVNKSASAVEFDLGVEFFRNLVLVEESKPVSQCLSSGKTLLPRMSGLMFKPADANPDEIDSVELTGLEITVKDGPDCIRP